MDKKEELILWFDQLAIEDVPIVGGKNASLGEMYRNLVPKGINIPNGFAITAKAYRYVLQFNSADEKIRQILQGLDTRNIKDLEDKGRRVREVIRHCDFPPDLKKQITEGYRNLCKQYGDYTDVAVRSSATAEDLPTASFAGQQETFLNIRGELALVDACKECFASLFTNRAISYREDMHFNHFKVALSIGVQKMVRSDLASAGVMFTIDTETGFKDVVFITGAYGLGENVVQGAVNPDEYYVFKTTLKKGFNPIISKKVGTKSIKMIYSEEGDKTTKNVPVPEADMKRYVLTEDEILTLAKWGCMIEDYYSEKAGHFKPMDMEWAKDGATNTLFIVQARPETVMSQKSKNILEDYVLEEKGKLLAKGQSVGDKIGQGDANIIKDVKDISNFRQGQVLVTDMTDPDWEPTMKMASAIITNRGGRTCFAGDTKILTNKGFMEIKDIFGNHEGIYAPSLNRETLKIEWKPVVASMKRKSKVIEVAISQTGRMKENNLRLTPDHHVLTYSKRELVGKEIKDVLKDKGMALLAQSLPRLDDSSEKDRKLAYLLGAISTDGHIYLTSRHGEVVFIQKPTEEKKEFIETVQNYMKDIYNKKTAVCKKPSSTGEIRGKPVHGSANAYRYYSKQIAQAMLKEKQEITQKLLFSDNKFIFSYLAGIIDGDGSYSKEANRINIYCSSDSLLQSIVVSCLRLGIVPQVSVNRTIYNVQIVEKIDEIFKYTKRVKGEFKRKRQGTRLFSAKELLATDEKINYKGRIKSYLDNNLLIDAEKIRTQVMPLASEHLKRELGRILESDTRMQRVDFVRDIGQEDVYNITVQDNHNYIVFTDRYSPVLVNNCHAAIISRELGIPCVVGTGNGTEAIKQGQKITVDCASGEDAYVYEGILKFRIDKVDIANMPKTKTKIMMNLGNPDQAFGLSFIPNAGVGLAREEFIINSYIKIHPNALLNFSKIKDERLKNEINDMTFNYADKTQYYIDELARGIATIAAAFYPRDVIVRMSDFKTNEYANLIGGSEYEPKEENPMLGFRGASRYYSPKFRDAFGLECKALKKVRDEMGLTNVKAMIPFCRTVDEGKKVLAEMEKYSLKRGQNGLEVYVMCEIPSNVILADEFSQIFDGFSIGTNDLTQLTLGLDRDSELVASIYDERNEAVKKLVAMVIERAKANKRKIGICGDAPSTFSDFAKFLVEKGIDSISLSPDAVIKTTLVIAEEEKRLGIKP